jgi:prepilin-type N-terminal cleavage/methylation domain-containing protein
MKLRSASKTVRARRGLTLAEVLVATAASGVLLASLMALFMSSLRNFQGLGNYSQLSGQSRYALDCMSKEIRECTQLVGASTNMPSPWLELTNSLDGKLYTYTWDSVGQVLTCTKVDSNGTSVRTNLTGCYNWQFSFYQRTPTNNWIFFPTTNQVLCKLINMSWRCSRTILGKPMNTEDMTTAEIVLRNKP